MKDTLRTYYTTIRAHLKPIFYRNTVTLTNIIFTAVTLLLLIFGEVQEALFMFSIVLLNSIVGIVQDMRAKIALEQLQILMTPKVKRVTENGQVSTVTPDDIRRHDLVKIELGDQIPADGSVVENYSLEVNEALLTGESANIGKSASSPLLAGSFVVAGSAVMRVEQLPGESYIALQTGKLKQYKLQLSPIQQTLTLFIQYMTYVLIGAIVFILVQGISGQQLMVSIVKDIAALTGTLVPQGLILATTVFFAYGAIKLFRQQVLLQEINATEKLGRIKNLCIDKTGTLTENVPVLERVVTTPQQHEQLAEMLVRGYFAATSDASHTAQAIEKKIAAPFTGHVGNAIPFSSVRKFGCATLTVEDKTYYAVVGAPDILLPHIAQQADQDWTQSLIDTEAPQAKRLLLLALADSPTQDSLTHTNLKPVAMFILANPLRAGTRDIIQFFQEHGVRIRVISGDNPETVRAIAAQAGIKYTDRVVTGAEMESWDSEMYADRVPGYHIFARIKPEQKERIVQVLKTSGFTAMVGDGANDALAIKKADLGIAMFDGAGATRSIAQIVLMNNSFAALPTGVRLADSIITNIELVSSIFFSKVAVGLLLFILLASSGFTYPISPRNTTVISYFTIGIPIFYWAIWPTKTAGRSNRPFLRKILPYSLLQSVIIALASLGVFAISPRALQYSSSNVLVVLTLLVLGFGFFLLAPIAYTGGRHITSKKALYGLTGIAAFLLLWLFSSAGLRSLFDLHVPPMPEIFSTALIVSATLYIQYFITKRWFGQSERV